MSFNLSIPGDKNLEINLNCGDVMFVLGANGTGKSSLMHKLYETSSGNVRRILAHRQTWFHSRAISMSSYDRKNAESNINASDKSIDSRWKDDYSHQRAVTSIYDLIDAENRRARLIADAMDSQNVELASELSKKDSPIKVINDLLKLSNLQIEISIRDYDEVIANKSNCNPYSIAELSDGERNALLIAADVLAAKPKSLILIDEPERHLHRSIISPLITLLVAHRSDCTFVISTHDVMLPLDNPSSRTLLLRACTYKDSNVTGWDADLIASEAEIDDELKKDILGGRRKLLFVEGTDRSLDKPIYSLIFPNVSVIAKSSCRDVEHAVSGIRSAKDLHWLQAFGIIDNDRRVQADIEQLRTKGVYAIPVFSIESIYYNLDIQKRVVLRHSRVLGTDAEQLLEGARVSALEALRPHIQRLSERGIEATIRQSLMSRLPRQSDISAAQPINVAIDIPAVVAAEVARLQQACDSGDLGFVIERYPVRETPVLGRIATHLGFRGREQYEGAVRKLLMDDRDALDFVRSLFGTLAADIAS
ncbi:AAA family ATPase [Inquilinus limosus]|uniref:AAA family ATPase n=1 Tax=Inquilinus limosus TaxID=171674 RepID=UPI003F168649